jgi:hypothetical protein
VIAAIQGLPPFKGITGTYAFNEKGDPVPATYFVLQANVADWNANDVGHPIGRGTAAIGWYVEKRSPGFAFQ